MKRVGLAVLAVIVVAVVAAALFFFLPASLPDVPERTVAERQDPALVERGRYLVQAGDCIACHQAPGGQPYAGGLAFDLPFGTIYSSNITPDPDTGIGNWTDAEFVRAMRQGVNKAGQNLYPAFPYTAYAQMSTEDILAIKSYLFTLAPVKAEQEPNKLDFPYDQRWAVRAWNLLYLPDGAMKPQPQQSGEWNRGAYLVEAFGHCGECHTPRNSFFALDKDQKFAGSVQQGWKAYNITSDETSGIGAWSVDELTDYLATGHSDGHGTAAGSMAEAVSFSLRHMSREDLHAMAVYLKSVPPQASEVDAKVDPHPPGLDGATRYSPPPGELGENEALGLRVFQGACASCHGWEGSGVQSVFAGLRGAQTVNDPAAINLLQVILKGGRLETEHGVETMPSFAAYSDSEIAAVASYVLGHFGGKQVQISAADVAKARQPAVQ
ncbi:cytochrome c [Aurantimonas sp. MSK8Z-1]|uniref:c-type cytochrome n=1 Tax=Mangrovibrevibacter kandeliae TaxID=2968473 RepID=UPI002118DE8B|nr:cytochrome c [Aurantimonas sp. MSK8Z-1]MCW4116085.1 cytochrome c [Aurantimonas sp. MSK8Z-1]